MIINTFYVYIDLILGFFEFLLLLAFFIKSENYSTFEFSYYYYLFAAPVAGISKIIQIIFSSVDSSADSKINVDKNFRNLQSITNKVSQLTEIFQLSLLSLVLIVPTCLEFLIGVISILIRSFINKDVSMDDLYLICYFPGIVSVMPLYCEGIKKVLPIRLVETIYTPFNLLGIIANTLVILIGGLFGRNIYINYLS